MAATVPSGGLGAAAAPGRESVRRDGERLWVPIANPVLPNFCVRCGAPGQPITKKFNWINPLLYLLILFGIIGIVVLAIVQAVAGKKMTLGIPLCPEHLASRKRMILIGALLTFGCVPLGILLGYTLGDLGPVIGLLVGFVAFFTGIILWARAVAIIQAKKIDDTHGEFTGVSEQFFARLAGR